MEAAHRITRYRGYDLSVWLHTENDAPKAMWDQAMRELAACPTKTLRSLVVTDGYAPDAARRSQLSTEGLRGGRIKSSIVTTVLSNPIKRGVATALTWLNPQFGFFTPEKFDAALAHIGLPDEMDAVWDMLGDLQLTLPPIYNLELIAKAFHLSPLPFAAKQA
jgi:hypothetical protein